MLLVMAIRTKMPHLALLKDVEMVRIYAAIR